MVPVLLNSYTFVLTILTSMPTMISYDPICFQNNIPDNSICNNSTFLIFLHNTMSVDICFVCSFQSKTKNVFILIFFSFQFISYMI